MAKRKTKEKPLNVFTLTCLNCKTEIEEHTQVKNPTVMIFDCMKCSAHWAVATATIAPKGAKS